MSKTFRTFGLLLVASLGFLGTTGPASASNWFWTVVPARMAEDGRAGAVDFLAGERAAERRLFGSPDLARRVINTWARDIETAAHASRLSEALITALVMVESAGRPDAVSHAGAQGLGQLMPGTARHLGVRDAFHPTQNLRGAASYLSDLLDMFDGDIVLALAAYNAGEGAVMRFKGVPPYAETRAYVPKVLSAYLIVRDFCEGRPSGDPRAACTLPRRL